MNKLMLFPLTIMFLLTVFTIVYTGFGYDEIIEAGDYDSQGTIIVGNESTDIQLQETTSSSVDIWSITGAVVLITVAMAAGTIAGFHFIGSGISELSQSMIFNGILFLGLWASLSVISGTYLTSNSFMMLMWAGLTMCYAIGFGFHVTGEGD